MAAKRTTSISDLGGGELSGEAAAFANVSSLRPAPEVVETDGASVMDGLAAIDAAIEKPAEKPKPKARKKKSDEVLISSVIPLPEQTMMAAKSLTRPGRTGASRALGVGLILQAYIRAIDELDLDIDVSGLDAGMEDEAVARVRQALDRWAATG